MPQGYQPRRQHGVQTLQAPPRNPGASSSQQERQVRALESIAASLAVIATITQKAAECQ